MIEESKKKNCINCKHLDYEDSDGYESSATFGAFCNKRQYRTELEEQNHLIQFEDDSYLEKSKSCFEPKN